MLIERKKKALKIFSILKQLFPNAPKTELRYKTPWQFLVAVMLSSQCTDKKVNEVTKILFKKYKTFGSIANAKRYEFEKDIYSTGFFRVKAKNIIATARIIKTKFQGKVPSSMSELLTLPGVARKTANVVLGNLYGTVEGITVDTHVARLARQLNLTTHTNPVKIEKDLMNIVPKKVWFEFANLLVLYGRYICAAKRHNHDACPLALI